MTGFEIDRAAVATAGEGGRAAARRPVGAGGRDAATGAAGRTGAGAPSDAACPFAPDPGGDPSLATLLVRARAAQAQLSAQPLPIANRDMLLVQKLFGG